MITLTSADSALKTVYLGVVAEQLNFGINPFLAKIKQSTNDVWGKEIRRVASYGVNGGFSSGDEDGDLPLAASNNYQQMCLTLKNFYGTIEISDKAMRASQNDAGAFVNLLNAEMDGLIKASTFNFGRMLFGDGTGFLCSVTSYTGTTFTVNSVKNLIEGLMVDLVDEDGESYNIGTRRILSIDRTTKKIVISGSSVPAATVTSDAYFVIQGSYDRELTGLGAIFKSTGSLYGLSRSSNKWLIPYMKSSVGSITETEIQKAIDYLEENTGSKVNFIVCSSGVKRALQNHLASYRRNIDVMELQGGCKAISFNGIPVVSDRFCPDGTMYLLNTDDFTLHQLCDWKWLEGNDGKVIRQIADKAIYTATLVKYADLICARPCGQAMLSGITEA